MGRTGARPSRTLCLHECTSAPPPLPPGEGETGSRAGHRPPQELSPETSDALHASTPLSYPSSSPKPLCSSSKHLPIEPASGGHVGGERPPPHHEERREAAEESNATRQGRGAWQKRTSDGRAEALGAAAAVLVAAGARAAKECRPRSPSHLSTPPPQCCLPPGADVMRATGQGHPPPCARPEHQRRVSLLLLLSCWEGGMIRAVGERARSTLPRHAVSRHSSPGSSVASSMKE